MTQPTGCHRCWPESADQAWEARGKLALEHDLADESHFGAHINRCDGCGQRFLLVFVERIDWANGDDPQSWVVLPLTPDEASALEQSPRPVADTALLGIGRDRRSLWRNAGGGKPETCFWSQGVGALVHD